MKLIQKLRCWFKPCLHSVSVADGVGGMNRYYLKECRHCGKKDWTREAR